MKRYISGVMVVAILFAGSLTVAPQPVQAETGDRVELQQQLINVLQQLIALLTGKDMTDDMMQDDDMMKDTMDKAVSQLSFDTNLAELEEGHYEGWLIIGDKKYSTGKFDAGDEMTFDIDKNLADLDKVVITIEPEGDTDDVPSGVVVLAGDVASGDVALSFPVDFFDASGSVILATPSDGSDTNETSGIWFLNLPDPSVALDLPELPSGWVYEGWAVHDGTPITSGRFTEVDEADDFAGFSGPEATPPFPGEDFLENAPNGLSFPIDLADGESAIVLSVEPDIDGVDPTGDGPAQAKPLLVAVAENQADHENIALDLNLDSLPRGSATLK